MKMDKIWKTKTAVFCTLLVAFVATASSAAAQTGGTVILVSDNVADSAVAEAVKNVEIVEIVTTPWGVYDEDVVTQIDTLEPDKVFILGGSAAVPSEYDEALSSYEPRRIEGRTRYETAARALKHFKGKFRGKGIIVAYGYDSTGIRNALSKAKKLGWIVLFVKPDDVPDEVVEAIDESETVDVEGIEFPGMDEDKIRKKMMKTKVRFKLSRLSQSDREGRASDQVKDAKEAIVEAEEAIGDCVGSQANHLLEQARKHLNKSDKADEHQSGKRFGQAVAAEHIARNAERFAKKHGCVGTTTSTTSTTETTTTTTDTSTTTTSTSSTSTTEELPTTTTTESTTTTTDTSTTTTEVLPTTTTTTSTTTTTVV
jgi:putative cell wall-binding protein